MKNERRNKKNIRINEKDNIVKNYVHANIDNKLKNTVNKFKRP